MYLEVGADDERTLVSRCLAGDSAAFQPLVEKYHGPLFRIAARMLGHREDARDATQSAFLKAYRALDRYDPGQKFFTWIYRILVNECLNAIRARKGTVPLDAAESIAGPGSPADAAEASESRYRVRRALMDLSAEQREVIVLRHFGGLSYAEVAETLGIPEKTVKSRLFGARQRLFDLLSGEVV
ncbi:MAG TPA: RNA polymerase sigma factor [Vicinamibacterales bacterium]|nr:RNA polymerase sigma factor [Vicinamibacterales bacterium]